MEAQQYYDETSDGYSRKWHDFHALTPSRPAYHVRRRVLDEVGRWLPQNGWHRVLDAGCGTGLAFRTLSRPNLLIVGLDISMAMLSHALTEAQQVQPRPRLACGDVRCLPFDSQAFSAVIGIEVVRYLTDPRGYFQEVKRVLRPGGMFLFTITPPWSPSLFPMMLSLRKRLSRIHQGEVPQWFRPPRHITSLLTTVGFDYPQFTPIGALYHRGLLRLLWRHPRLRDLYRQLEPWAALRFPLLCDTLLVKAQCSV